MRGVRGKAEPFGSSNLPVPTIQIRISAKQLREGMKELPAAKHPNL